MREDGNRLYLTIGIVASLCLHAAVIAWHFGTATQVRPPVESIDVTLVNARTPEAPVAPQVKAQANLNAGGNPAAKSMASSPLPRTADTPDTVILEALRKRQAQLEAEQQKLLTQLLSQRAVAPSRRHPELFQASSDPGEDNENRESALLNAQISAIKERIEHYNARPRQQFIGPSAQSAEEAAYVEAWRKKIELIGTEHYPAQARGKIYGTLQLTVYIRRDGELERVEIDKASDQPILNLAARRIVQLAAPFPPLPPALAQKTDILAITRTWHFTRDSLTTQ